MRKLILLMILPLYLSAHRDDVTIANLIRDEDFNIAEGYLKNRDIDMRGSDDFQDKLSGLFLWSYFYYRLNLTWEVAEIFSDFNVSLHIADMEKN